jgi:hypothetical protein
LPATQGSLFWRLIKVPINSDFQSVCKSKQFDGLLAISGQIILPRASFFQQLLGGQDPAASFLIKIGESADYRLAECKIVKQQKKASTRGFKNTL